MISKSTACFGVGIRGAGQVAYQYAEAIQEDPYLTLVGISSRTEESAEKLASHFKTSGGETPRVYPSYEALLEDPQVDVVIECMPNYLHAREAILALEADKHLVLEKPPAITYEELELLRETARKNQKKSVVGFVLRWHPMIRNIRSLLDKEALGSVYYAEMDYWHGIKPSFSSYSWIRKQEFAGGAMITGGCHAADLARYLKGEVQEVFAYSYRQREDFDYPTTFVATLRFEDNTVGKLSASLDGVSFPYQFNIDLLGSNGAIRGNRIYSSTLFPSQDRWMELPCSTPDSGVVSHHPFKEEIHAFSTALTRGSSLQPDILDGLRSMEISLAITESAQTGKPVSIGKPSS